MDARMFKNDETEILRAEYAAIPAQIKSYEDSNAARRQRMAELDAALNNLNRDLISPTEARIAKLDARKTVLTAPARIGELSDQIQPLQTVLADLTQRHSLVVEQIRPIDMNIRRYHSAIEMIQAQNRRNQLAAPLAAAVENANVLASELSSQRTALHTAETNLSHARSRLISLETQQRFDYAFNHSPFHGYHGHHGHGHHHHHGHAAGDFFHAVGDGMMYSSIYNARDEVSRCETVFSHSQNNVRSCESRLRAARQHEEELRTEMNRVNLILDRVRHDVNQADLALSIPALQNMEHEQQVLRTPLESQRADLQRQIDANNHARSGLIAEHDALRAKLANALPLAESDVDINRLNDAAEIEKQLMQMRDLHQQYLANEMGLKNQKREQDQAIAQAVNFISGLKARQSELGLTLKYPNAVDRFEALLRAMPINADHHVANLYQYGWNLLREIKKEKAAADHKDPGSFNKTLYADILDAASGVLSHDNDLYWTMQLATLAEKNQSGKQSIAKTVIGAIGLVIGGAMLIAASAMLGSFVPFLSWPIAAIGVAVGAGLLAGGIALIVNGRQKGIDKAVHRFADAIPAANQSARMFYQPAPQHQHVYPQLNSPVPTAPPLGY